MPINHESESSTFGLTRHKTRNILIGLTAVTLAASAGVIYETSRTPPLEDHMLLVGMEPDPITGIPSFFQKDPYKPLVTFNAGVEEGWKTDALKNSSSSQANQMYDLFNNMTGQGNDENSKFRRDPQSSIYNFLIDKGKRNQEASLDAIKILYKDLDQSLGTLPTIPAEKFISDLGAPSWTLESNYTMPVLNLVDNITKDIKANNYPVTVIAVPIGMRNVTFADSVVSYKDGFQNNHIKKITVDGKDYWSLIMGNNINFNIPILPQKAADGKILAVATTVSGKKVQFDANPDVNVPVDAQRNYYLDNTYAQKIDAATDDELVSEQSSYSEDNPYAAQNIKQIEDLAQEANTFIVTSAGNGGKVAKHLNKSVLFVAGSYQDEKGIIVETIENADIYVDLTDWSQTQNSEIASEIVGSIVNIFAKRNIPQEEWIIILQKMSGKTGITKQNVIQMLGN